MSREELRICAHRPDFLCGYRTRGPETKETHSMIISSSQGASDFQALITSRFQAIGRSGSIGDILRPAGAGAGGPGSSEVA
jgi:hypothetical protein